VDTVEYKEGSIDKTKFVEYSENSATVAGHDSDCTRVLKYGYPGSFGKYGYPGSFVKYGYYGTGASCAVVQDDCGCQVEKYGFPPLSKYGHPGSFVKYGYYGAGTGCEVVQDDCGCQVEKYGFPPLGKYGYFGCKS
jgi:hypothetical protein